MSVDAAEHLDLARGAVAPYARMFPCSSLLEDLRQEAALGIVMAAKTATGARGTRAFLAIRARGAVRDFLRRQGWIRGKLPSDSRRAPQFVALDWEMAGPARFDLLIERKVDTERLAGGISDRQRQVVQMLIEGYSQAEAARALGMSESSVCQLRSAAIASMRLAAGL